MFLNVGFDNMPPDYREPMPSFDRGGGPNNRRTSGEKSTSHIVEIILTIIIIAVMRTVGNKIAPINFKIHERPKEFTFANMTITLTNQFRSAAVPEEAREWGVKRALITPDETMCFIGTMDGFDNMTYDEAIGKLDEVINRNQTYKPQKMVRHQKDGLTYYTIEQYIEGAMYSHYAFCYFYEGKIWTAEFYTKHENIDKYEELFVKWAKSVEFGPFNAESMSKSTKFPLALRLVLALVSLSIITFLIITTWKLFKKAGEHGWAVLIPFYNVFVMFKIVFGKDWYAFLLLIPFFAWKFVPFVGQILVLALDVIISFKLAKAFGKGTRFGFGLLFLPLIFQPILALGDAVYVGPARQNSGGETSFPEGGQD